MPFDTAKSVRYEETRWESCQDTVPQAITAFPESTDFKDTIRNAISLGGDSDTLAAITGGIAEAADGKYISATRASGVPLQYPR